MPHDQTHAFQHPPAHVADDFVGHFAVGHVAPPDQHVGVLQAFRRKSVVRLVEGGGGDCEIRLRAEKPGDRLVDAVRIDRGDFRVGFLVAELAPDDDPGG